jgi:16S rRNA (cytidine1402-2'-O)-methyltransferase
MRLIRTLNDILDHLGDRPAVIGRELTKIHEEYQRGKVSELIKYFKKNKPRGEFVIMIGKDDKNVYF